MLIRRKYSVWRVDGSLSKLSCKKMELSFFTGKQGFDFLCSCKDLSAFQPYVVFCKKINSANEYLVFVR